MMVVVIMQYTRVERLKERLRNELNDEGVNYENCKVHMQEMRNIVDWVYR